MECLSTYKKVYSSSEVHKYVSCFTVIFKYLVHTIVMRSISRTIAKYQLHLHHALWLEKISKNKLPWKNMNTVFI